MSTVIPEEVPVLTEKNILKNKYDNHKGQYCSISWIGTLFPMTTIFYSKRYGNNDITVLANALIGTPRDDLRDSCKIVEWNDNKKTTKVAIARFLNRLTALLGYTEGNPQRAWAVKNKKKFRKYLPEWAK